MRNAGIDVKWRLTIWQCWPYAGHVIRSFRHRGLARFWQQRDASGIRSDLARRLELRLSRLNAASRPEEMNLPGFNFHRLRGRPVRYTVHVNSPWCITFEWEGEDAVRVDLEQYH